MPNRRRRKLSTAMSAVAALAVASPCAYFLVYEATSGPKPPEHHEFKQAANIADLPGELIGALSQGLSQFGINVPPVPALGGTSTASTGLGSPGLGASPGLTSPGLTSPGLTSPGLTPSTPGSLALPGTTVTPPTPGAGVNPALTNPALTSPTGVAPGLTSPTGLSPASGTGEIPITSPVGLDPGADGTYPILGDTSGLGGVGSGTGLSPVSPASTGTGGGLVNDLMQAANQLGASQAIDLLKGLVMPAIMQGVQNGGAGAAGAAPGAPALPAGAVPAAAGAVPAPAAPVAGAIPAPAAPVAGAIPAPAAPVAGAIPAPAAPAAAAAPELVPVT
ncbi:Exported repetitive protein [Mycobacterium simulans]|uniref:hypothetical protein n=1 Tax=Mycobacterium simulans TaxID=627089 RepID=UPI00174B393C|nr:hypothetical protein [Mycobacterium simulans]SON59906.1 Exported repetitive protein [Mycobacterium simulans]